MNNRKYPRLSDGYHERSPYHPYQSKKQTNCIADSRDRERSPTGSNSRDNSPYSSTNRHSSSSPRSQRTKFPYSRSKDGAKKGSSQSPNDFLHRGSNSHPTERHTKFNHISNNEEFPWSQHVSSSGKVYYYNFKTEKSQWEKPKEWLERERREKETKEKEHNLVGSKEVRDVGLLKDDPTYEKSRNYVSKTSIKEFSSNDRRDRSRGHIDERGRENHQISNSERGQTVVKTTSVHTSALPTVSHRSTPMAATLSGSSVVSPAGSLQDVSPPSTPSSRASIFESSSHTPSPQLVSVSPHGTPYQTSQSPIGHQQLPVRHQAPLQNIFTQVSSSTTPQQCTKQQYSMQQLQSNSAHHGLVNNGNPQTIALTTTSGQSQKTYDVEMGSRPALHPLQQATLLHQRKITESRNHGMSNYQQSTFPVIPHPTLPLSPAATLVKENNKIRKSPGSPVIFAQSHGTKNSPGSKEQFHSVPQIQTSFGSTFSSKAQASPVSPVAVQPTPVNLQTLAKYVDKSLTNHVNNWPTEGGEKQIQRLYDEGCSHASDANKVLVQQIQLQSQIDILEMRLDVGTKRISSLKEVTKTLELLLAESDKKSLM